MANPDDIHAALSHVAGSINVGDLETARASVHGTLNRRRRRSRVAAGLGAGVLLVGGVVAFASFDNSDEAATLVVVDSTTTTTVAGEEDDSDDVPATTQPDASGGSAAQPDSPSTSAVAVGGQGAAVSSPNVGSQDGPGQQWLVSWEDGFLAIAPIYEPQTLPPDRLPDDIRELFPEEVLELFPDGLPPTVAEATTILEEAGLLDVVTEIINSNAEANSAILGAPIGPPSLETSFTVDGTNWEPVEMTLPVEINDVRSVLSVGDRLVVLSSPPYGPSGQVGGVQIATTTDLTTWTTQTIDIPPPPIELPSYVNRGVGAQNLVANESGWVVSVNDFIDIDVESLLPADVVDPTTEGGFGYGTSNEGVEIYLDPDGEDPLTFTWDELGVPSEIVDLMNGGSFNEEQLWAASWDGVPVRSELTREFPGTVIATDAGFLSLTDQSWFSADGVAWAATDLSDVQHVNEYMTYDGGLIVVGRDEDGRSSLFRVDSRGKSAESIDVPGLPDQVQGAGFPESAGGPIMFDANVPEVNTDPLILQTDGYELSMLMTNNAYELRNSAGEIVLSEDGRSSDGAPPDANFVPGREGWSFSDPETGEVLAFFPTEVVDAAFQEQFGPSPSGQEYDPDFWMIATADGEQFIVEDVGEGGVEYGWPMIAAVNGDTMLVSSDGSWTRYTFP